MTTITDPREAERILAEAACYAEFVLTTEFNGRVREMRLMARDIPRQGRRCTNLTHGTEWFINPGALAGIGFASLTW